MTRKANLDKEKKFQDKVMSQGKNNMSAVCSLLQSKRGDSKRSPDIPYIDTLDGLYEGENVLEGFRTNTELLCNNTPEKDDTFDEIDFHEMCVSDNEIILKITDNEVSTNG